VTPTADKLPPQQRAVSHRSIATGTVVYRFFKLLLSKGIW
jgi:hypothetical protein